MQASLKSFVAGISFLATGIAAAHYTANAQIGFTLPAHPGSTGTINAMEYYYDQDPGLGNGTAIPITPSGNISGTYTFNISALNKGEHRLFVRARNSIGLWSHTHTQTFVTYKVWEGIPPTDLTQADIVKAEYFTDTDPGAGNGTDLPLTPGKDVTLNNIALNVAGLPIGVHTAYVRFKNANGQWSMTNYSKFTFIVNNLSQLPAHPAGKQITKVEYFFDTDPGLGTGRQIPVPSTANLSDFNFAADLTGLAIGQHNLYVRTLDGLSMTNVHGFTIGNSGPLPLKWLSFQAMQEGKTALLKWRTADEKNNRLYTIERSMNGKDFKVIGKVDASKSDEKEHSYSFTDETPASGTNYYRLKQTDLDDRFTYSAVIPLFMNAVTSEVTINNPVQQTLIINSNSTNNAPVKAWITNQAGNSVLQTELNNNTQQVDVSNLQPGIYLLNLGTDIPDVLRFVKQ